MVAPFTPLVFGLSGGSATRWLLGCLQGKRFDDLLLPANHRAPLLTMVLASATGIATDLVGRQVQVDPSGLLFRRRRRCG